MRRRARGVAFSIALAAVVLLVAAPAHAKPTNVTWPVHISVKAAPGARNNIRMSYEEVLGAQGESSSWYHFIWDTAGATTRVTDGPTCYPIDRVIRNHPLKGKVVACPDGTSHPFENNPSRSFPGVGEQFGLGDRSDRFSAGDSPREFGERSNLFADDDSPGEFKVHGGSGNDRLYGNSAPSIALDFESGSGEGTYQYFTEDMLYGDRGNDRLYGREGPDLLSGGPGDDRLYGGKVGKDDTNATGRDDTLLGGSGNDVLRAADGDRDRRIDCGPGTHDKAYIDRQDPKPKHCEKVKRNRHRSL